MARRKTTTGEASGERPVPPKPAASAKKPAAPRKPRAAKPKTTPPSAPSPEPQRKGRKPSVAKAKPAIASPANGDSVADSPTLPIATPARIVEPVSIGETRLEIHPQAARSIVEPAPTDWRERLGQYWLLVRGHRPIGILLLMWPTWWALWLAADGFPAFGLWLIFTLGVWLTRSAGCVINDYADRWLDPQVERTKSRPLATGAVSGREALIVFAVLMLVAFALVLLTNTLTVELSFIGALLAASYPYLKRHTYLPQVYLGLAFGWGIPMAFAATQGTVPALAWLLFLANVVWATAYDTWYAMVDRDDDLRAGAKSTAILFGPMDLVAQGLLYAVFIAALVFVGVRAAVAPAYYFGVAVTAGLIAWEFSVARGRDRDGCFRAFLHNNWVGATVFVAVVLGVTMR